MVRVTAGKSWKCANFLKSYVCESIAREGVSGSVFTLLIADDYFRIIFPTQIQALVKRMGN